MRLGYTVLSRLRSLARYTIAYACITHCTFEYVGDFVLVSAAAAATTAAAVQLLLIFSFSLCLSLSLLLAIDNRFHLLLFQCKGPSMEPTLFSDNVLLTERISKYWRKYKSGDIIIAISPVNSSQYICKRIVAVSGERISTLKPNPLEAETLGTRPTAHAPMVTDYVPHGCVWIEGDNKSNSSDSRYYGPLPLGLIRSRVVCRIWPLSELTGL